MAQQRTHKDELDRINMEKTKEILSELPLFVSDYFSSRKSNTTTRTRLSYAYDVRNFLRYIHTNYALESNPEKLCDITVNDLNRIKARDIEGYLDYLQTDAENMNHKAGIARKLSAISSFFDYLYRNDLVPENPCAKVLKVRPPVDNRIIRLSPDEVVRFLNAIENTQGDFTERQKVYLKNTALRDLTIATVFLGTGIRVSELVGLNISDVYLDKCQMSILGKGDKYRMVALSDETIEQIEKYLPERLKISPSDHFSEDALFLSTQRKRITVQAVENLITKYAEAIGLSDRITPHKLRKTYGTELYSETGDIYLVANSLGHSNVNTTKNHYVAQDEQNLLEVRNRIKLRK